MVWIFIWDTAPSKIFVWWSEVASVWAWDTKVRPSIINFATQWPCPDGFHVPLYDERYSINQQCTSRWLWSSSSWWNNLGTYLKMPKAWWLSQNQHVLVGRWETAYYWSSSAYNWENAHELFIMNWAYVAYGYKCQWGSIRPFKNETVTPDSSWNRLYNWWSNKWIYWNSSLWLISIVTQYDWTFTMSDKNLWATTVYNQWDALTDANCWWYYQRWNNYMFGSTVSEYRTTQTNASTYWPWNYYSNNIFIYRTSSPYKWDTSDNANLRWWVDGNVPV